MRIGLVILTLVFFSQATLAAKPKKTSDLQTVKYKAPKEINLDSLVIEGQLKRPDLSVVTGESESSRDGLLRLREDFSDRLAEDAGEEIP